MTENFDAFQGTQTVDEIVRGNPKLEKLIAEQRAAEKARQEQEKAKEEAEVASAVKGGALDLRAFHKQLAAKEAAEKMAKVSGINEQIRKTGNVQEGGMGKTVAPWRPGYEAATKGLQSKQERTYKTAEMPAVTPAKKPWYRFWK